MLRVLLLASASLVFQVHAFGNGAPDGACVNLTPGHNGGTEDVNLPYMVSVGDVTSYVYGTPVEVTVSSTDGSNFQGMLCQARMDNSTTPLGTFSVTGTKIQTTMCTAADDSVTHSNTDEVNSVTFMWNPPMYNMNDVMIRCTVAQVKLTWRRNIDSAMLMSNNTATVDEMTPTMAEMTTTTSMSTTTDAASSLTAGLLAILMCFFLQAAKLF